MTLATMCWALRPASSYWTVGLLWSMKMSGSTIGRILGVFGPGEERLVRMRLAESLRYVVSQRLLPREGGGRVAAFEVLKNTLRVKELILQGESVDKTFYSVLEAGEIDSTMARSL